MDRGERVGAELPLLGNLLSKAWPQLPFCCYGDHCYGDQLRGCCCKGVKMTQQASGARPTVPDRGNGRF